MHRRSLAQVAFKPAVDDPPRFHRTGYSQAATVWRPPTVPLGFWLPARSRHPGIFDTDVEFIHLLALPLSIQRSAFVSPGKLSRRPNVG